MLDIQQKSGIFFELFLFPNNVDAGSFEDLLIKLVNPKYNDLLDCFDIYCDCISDSDCCKLKPPLKSKVFAFLEASGQMLKIDKVDFMNVEYWDLNHEALNNLKAFLEKFKN